MVEYDNEFDNERVKNLAKKKIELQHSCFPAFQ